MTQMPDADEMREALRHVEDPEAGMNIVDLGLVYDIDVGPGSVRIEMTMTTAACPMADLIIDRVRAVVAAAVPDGAGIDVRLVWEPPWTPDRMSDMARAHFGWT